VYVLVYVACMLAPATRAQLLLLACTRVLLQAAVVADTGLGSTWSAAALTSRCWLDAWLRFVARSCTHLGWVGLWVH
jgi:hypothetical protein